MRFVARILLIIPNPREFHRWMQQQKAQLRKHDEITASGLVTIRAQTGKFACLPSTRRANPVHCHLRSPSTGNTEQAVNSHREHCWMADLIPLRMLCSSHAPCPGLGLVTSASTCVNVAKVTPCQQTQLRQVAVLQCSASRPTGCPSPANELCINGSATSCQIKHVTFLNIWRPQRCPQRQ